MRIEKKTNINIFDIIREEDEDKFKGLSISPKKNAYKENNNYDTPYKPKPINIILEKSEFKSHKPREKNISEPNALKYLSNLKEIKPYSVTTSTKNSSKIENYVSPFQEYKVEKKEKLDGN